MSGGWSPWEAELPGVEEVLTQRLGGRKVFRGNTLQWRIQQYDTQFSWNLLNYEGFKFIINCVP